MRATAASVEGWLIDGSAIWGYFYYFCVVLVCLFWFLNAPINWLLCGKVVEEKDTLFCRIQQKSMAGLILTVLCIDPLNGKSRSVLPQQFFVIIWNSVLGASDAKNGESAQHRLSF